MKHISIATALILAAMSAPANAIAQSQSDDGKATVKSVLMNYLPGTSALGPLRVENLTVDKKKKTISVDCNWTASYIPFTAESLARFKNDVRAALGSDFGKYKVNVYAVERDGDGKEARRYTFDDLALFSNKTVKAPTEKKRFVTDLDAPAAPGGLDGKNIALWQSHGWYFEPKLNRWEWQRARIFQTVEDLYTQSYVMPYLMPMLENAGAYVMSPRERDVNTTEIIVDNDGGDFALGEYTERGSWADTSVPGFGYTLKELRNGDNPFRAGTARKALASSKASSAPSAAWTADFPKNGNYAVYVSYVSEPNSATDAVYTVNSLEGARRFKVNQKMGGGTWIYLGHFPFAKGKPELPVVELSGVSADKKAVITADAVKIGGGMGNVARIVKEPLDSIDYQYTLSNYPRFVEGARYFLQWAGAPDSVYTPSGDVNDYRDDYCSRALWVNWLTGGSSVLPKREGLNIPVDLAFAFHSDAGTTRNDSIIGTLGIYSTDGKDFGKQYANGSSRFASRDFTDLVLTNIVDDIRRVYEPKWTRRGMWDKQYYEARYPEVPTMLLELLSHQNFADMKYGLDPEFRFLVSRAVYKGMLKFLANRDGVPYVVTPLAPGHFAISTTDVSGEYRLSWTATPDSLEETAVPSYYIVEERIADGGFRQIAKVTEPVYTARVSDGVIHSYRIVAGNDGGVSFPSEVLALCNVPGSKGTVNVVNGFTRISAPDWFDSGEIAGFYDVRDHGVPDVQDISFIGSQFEFRRDIPWMDDDAAGFGASRSNYEKDVIAGNTRDYVAVHGKAIADAGYSFVSSSVAAYVDSPVSGEPMIVDLILGKQKEIQKGTGAFGTRYKAFPSALQNKIKAFTEAGGDVFVSGAYVATDIWDNPFSSEEVAKADKAFASEVLGYNWRVGQASVTGQAYQVDCRFRQFTGGDYSFSNELNPDCYAVESPDSFYASDSKKGCTFMRYTENNLVAGTAFDNGYRTVVIGFPFETISGASSRASLMKQVLDFLTDK